MKTYKNDTVIIKIFITKLQRERVERVSKYFGKAMTDVAVDAILKHIKELEAEIESDELKRAARKKAFNVKNEREWSKPKGLGLESSNEGFSPKSMDTEIERFVAYVAHSKDEQDLERRGRAVLEMIIDTCTKAEAEKITQKLDDEIKRLKENKKLDPRIGDILDLD